MAKEVKAKDIKKAARDAKRAMEKLEDILEDIDASSADCKVARKAIRHLRNIEDKYMRSGSGTVNEGDVEIASNADRDTVKKAMEIVKDDPNKETNIRITENRIKTTGKTLKEVIEVNKREKRTFKAKELKKIIKEALNKKK